MVQLYKYYVKSVIGVFYSQPISFAHFLMIVITENQFFSQFNTLKNYVSINYIEYLIKYI